jgi:hypothetical protein
VLVLDLGHRVAQRGAERLAAQLGLAGHPGPQVLLLAAGQAGDGDGIGGLALHEGERLQHGVVQVGGHPLALVLPATSACPRSARASPAMSSGVAMRTRAAAPTARSTTSSSSAALPT